MSWIKASLWKIGHFLLSIVRVLRKVLCCRRKKEPEYLLPMTVGHIIDMDQIMSNEYENQELKSEWDAWPEASNQNIMNNGNVRTSSLSESSSQMEQMDDSNEEDFFKDMVPQIRKPKKLFIKNEMKHTEQEKASSNRLAMDPNAILMDPDLGVIDDNATNWEDNENLDEVWDTDLLLREKKRAEQEMRRAEHQRRKQEREIRRSSKPESLSSIMMSLSDSKDKHKFS